MDDMSLWIVPGLFLVGLPLLICLVISLRRRVLRQRRHILKSGHRADARVVDAWSDDGGSQITYRFWAERAGKPVLGCQCVDGVYPVAPDVGQMVHIAYDPDAPENSLLLAPKSGVASKFCLEHD